MLTKHQLPSLIFLIVLAFTGCNDDGENMISGFSLESITLEEGNSLNSKSLVVQVMGTLQSDISVSYKIQEGTAKVSQDIVASSGELTLSASQPTAIVTVEIVGDTNLELTESFFLIIPMRAKNILWKLRLQMKTLWKKF
jgi:hypothetical protein